MTDGLKERGKDEAVEVKDLAELVAQACPVKERHKHPATRTFQAIRIYIIVLLKNPDH